MPRPQPRRMRSEGRRVLVDLWGCFWVCSLDALARGGPCPPTGNGWCQVGDCLPNIPKMNQNDGYEFGYLPFRNRIILMIFPCFGGDTNRIRIQVPLCQGSERQMSCF